MLTWIATSCSDTSISQLAMGDHMAFKFLDAAGQIDEAKVSVAVARKADDLARWRRSDIEACTSEALAWVRRLADDERKAWIADQQDRVWGAAAAFVAGALDGLTPPRTEPFVIEAIEGPDVHTFDRMDAIQSAIGNQIIDARRNTFARALASFDRSLAGIAASDDITVHLQAAE
ncbi:hypothetical protein AB6806_27295 [Bosea sp. RCC_152_1]|uniref:hypothetical protein n=1 Tax=Bosea sp. RCC_152_1 TaxID=3239228 RepID=UPI0035232651